MKKICKQCGQKDCGFVNREMEYKCQHVQDYQQGFDDAVEKACEWWTEELITPTMTQEGRQWFKNKVNAYRKAMEGGENERMR